MTDLQQQLATDLAELQAELFQAGMPMETSATLMMLSGNLSLVAGPDRAIEVLQFCAGRIANAPSHLRLVVE